MSVSNDNVNNCSNACIVCYRNVSYYSIGMCEHPVCYECSTRMRVLCLQNECPICRQDMPKVVFTKEIKPFRFLKKGNLLDTKYNIYFDSEEIQEMFLKLLAHTCTVCHEKQIFNSFNTLKDHMKRKHDLHYCELCVENLKIFSMERRSYTVSELLQHQCKGDLDDKSHKGHPLCKFCDKRYMDIDELYRHLRRDHLFCHFCDADGLHQYYDSYNYLRKHFQKDHYLCEEAECAEEQFTSVFRTDIDLKAHKASVHGKHLGKAAAKQARTLELEFTLAPRGDLRLRRGPPGGSRGNGQQHHHHHHPQSNQYVEPEPPEEPVFARQPLVDVQSTQEFPRLGNAASSPQPIMNLGQSKTRSNYAIGGSLRKDNYDENFPALGPESAAPPPPSLSKILNFSVSSKMKGVKPSSAKQSQVGPNASTNVNHRPNGMVMTRLSSSANLRLNSGVSRDKDFPALGRASAESLPGPSTQSWTKVTCVKSTEPRDKKVAPPPLASSPPPLSSGHNFPSLAKTAKAGKGQSATNPGLSSAWPQIHTTDTNDGLSALAADATKGKAKKKKMKQQQQQQQPSFMSNGSTTQKPIKKPEQKTKPKNTEQTSNAQPSNTQGKRSELKIESLNTKNNNLSIESKIDSNKIQDAGFPALEPTGSRPPGFTSPPPGFRSPTAAPTSPPPGFLSHPNSLILHEEVCSQQRKQQDHTFQPPENFQRRNQSLIAKFNDCFGPETSDDFKAFRYLSQLFRSGMCDASIYYEQCRAMDPESFKQLFPELLALLPDIDKQRELYELHRLEASTDESHLSGLTECANCGQILLHADLKSHVTSHTLENHFPALNKNSPSPRKH